MIAEDPFRLKVRKVIVGRRSKRYLQQDYLLDAFGKLERLGCYVTDDASFTCQDANSLFFVVPLICFARKVHIEELVVQKYWLFLVL